MVDPEPALQIDQLVGNLGGRADQEAVGQQLGEFVVEIVALGHDLVLAPFAVGVVLGLRDTGGRGGSPRRGCGRQRPRAASAIRPGTACHIRRGPGVVDFHLPRQGRQGVVRVDVPAIAEPGRPPDRDIGVGPDPDRRMRLLQWLDREFAWSSVKCDPAMSTKSSVHSRLTASEALPRSARRPPCGTSPNALNSTSR